MTKHDLDRPLSAGERKDLATHLETIRRGTTVFMEVGAALLDIQNRHLYRGTYPNFKAFYEANGFSKDQTYRWIDAFQVAKELPGIVNERQAREINRLSDAEDRENVYADACEQASDDQDAPTARQIRAAVERHLDTVNGEAPKPDAVIDGQGGDVSDNPKLRAAFAIRPDLLALARQISTVKGGLVKHLGGPGAELLQTTRVGQLVELRRHVLQATPYCACPSCEGDGCEACEGRGWIPEYEYKKLEAV